MNNGGERAAEVGEPPAQDAKGTLTTLWHKAKPSNMDSRPAAEVVDLTNDSAPDEIAGASLAPATALEVTPDAPCAMIAGAPTAVQPPRPANEAAGTSAAAAAAAAAAGTSAAATGSKVKKRKRGPAPAALAPEQTAALEAAFAAEQYPKADAKAELAARAGLAAERVGKWFEKRRKALREAAGEPMKRGRPAAGAPGSAAPAPAPAPAVPAAAGAGAGAGAGAAGAQLRARRAELEAELAELLARGLAPPLVDLAAATGAPAPFSDARLAALVAGQTAPLDALVAALGAALAGAPAAAALRARVLDLATRKSWGAHRPAAEGADLFSDADAEALWQWELRDAKAAPKDQRAAAAAARKRADGVAARLKALAAALAAMAEGAAPAAVARALAALAAARPLAQLEAEAAAAAAAAAERAAAAEAARAAKAEEGEAARAEKERARAEKEAERERQRAEREADRERKAAEAAAAKLARKTGFKDGKALVATASKFKSFFKAAGGGASRDAPSASATTSLQESAGGSGAGGSAAGAAGGGAAAVESRFAALFPKPSREVLALQPLLAAADAAVDAGLAAGAAPEAAAAEWRAALERARAARRARAADAPRRAGLGLPPSWARSAAAPAAAAARARALAEAGTDPAATAAECRRRKFLWCPADSGRPPFHGSWPRSDAVTGRRPFARDAGRGDYAEASDEDWEEEPEGEALSGDDGEEEAEEAAGEASDSFMVADGYLSADEGVGAEEGEEEESDDGAEGGVEAKGGAAAGGEGGAEGAARDRKAAQLHAALERARRAGRPLIISRLGGGGDAARPAPGAPPPPHLTADVGLLDALALEVLVPGALALPPGDAAEEAAAAAALPAAAAAAAGAPAAAGAAGAPRPRGRPAVDRADLLPVLRRFIAANATLPKPRLIAAFVETHAEQRVPKSWAAEKITELAENRGGRNVRWELRPGAPGGPPAPPAAAADASGAAPAAGPLDRLLARAAASPRTAPLAPPAAVSGPGDAFWVDLVARLDGGDAAGCAAAFAPAALARLAPGMPAFVPAALVSALGRNLGAATPRRALTCALRATAEALVAAEGEGAGAGGAGADATASQRAWGAPRAAPAPATAAELAAEPWLFERLQACVFGAATPDAEAAADARGAAQALARTPAGAAAAAVSAWWA
jgi:hypothetical protein